ncbi:fatty acid-binding protein-like [Melitaea cinxia]|uniref:fatty acid-binding protein-like n=1 Tax=Melitaea cinxia TaxID=113334 RepID=UPI001E272D87|nr:fatty acid-binding protein-like [Melitaea cinxia]
MSEKLDSHHEVFDEENPSTPQHNHYAEKNYPNVSLDLNIMIMKKENRQFLYKIIKAVSRISDARLVNKIFSVDSTFVIKLSKNKQKTVNNFFQKFCVISVSKMESFFGKKYKLKSSENFEEYLKFIEVGLLSRKLVTSLYPVCILTKNEDGSYSLTMITAIRKVVTTFKLGEEFIEDRPDGVKVKSIMTLEGNKLIQIQIENNGRKSTHIREFTDQSLTVTTTAEGWNGTCVRVYELVE